MTVASLAIDPFDITRSTSGHVGFRSGSHQRLGRMVARMEAEALRSPLVPRVAAIAATGRPVRRPNDTLHALASLPLRFAPA